MAFRFLRGPIVTNFCLKVRSSGQILDGRWLNGARIDIAGRNLTKRRGFPRTRKIDM